MSALDSQRSHEDSEIALSASPAAPDESDEARIQKRLAAAIYEHRVRPGTKLPEADLCRIYGVTRGVIRKVFDRLATEQLVELIPNRGAFVARPSVELTRDVYGLRRILETGVVRSLSHDAHHGWLPAVRLQVAEEREANRVGDNGRYIRLAGKFHLDLAAATGNAALEQHLRRVVSQTSLMTALYDVPGTNTCSVLEHLEILDAIEAGDFALAERRMEEHLLGCERQLRLGGEDNSNVDLAQALAPAATDALPKGPPPGGRPRGRRPAP
jgi:DNA-binding GntR family transcriptional regulator